RGDVGNRRGVAAVVLTLVQVHQADRHHVLATVSFLGPRAAAVPGEGALCGDMHSVASPPGNGGSHDSLIDAQPRYLIEVAQPTIEGLVACLFPQEFTGEFGHGSKSTRVLWSLGTKCRILFDTGPTVAGQPDPGAPTEAVGSAHDLARITSVGRSVQLVGAAVGHQGLTDHVLGVAPPIPAAPPVTITIRS